MSSSNSLNYSAYMRLSWVSNGYFWLSAKIFVLSAVAVAEKFPFLTILGFLVFSNSWIATQEVFQVNQELRFFIGFVQNLGKHQIRIKHIQVHFCCFPRILIIWIRKRLNAGHQFNSRFRLPGGRFCPLLIIHTFLRGHLLPRFVRKWLSRLILVWIFLECRPSSFSCFLWLHTVFEL